MNADDVQVVRIIPPTGAYWLSANACHDTPHTRDWKVGFFKTLAAASQTWKEATGHRFAAATIWRICPEVSTVEGVIDELKRKAAQCNYARLEVFSIIPPRIFRK